MITQYAIKVYVDGHVFTVGPVDDRDEAKQLQKDIASGAVDEVRLQNRSEVIFGNVPDAVQLLKFERKESL